MQNAEESAPAFSIYSAVGGLPQDPGEGAKSSPRSIAAAPAQLTNQSFAALSRTNQSRRQILPGDVYIRTNIDIGADDMGAGDAHPGQAVMQLHLLGG